MTHINIDLSSVFLQNFQSFDYLLQNICDRLIATYAQLAFLARANLRCTALSVSRDTLRLFWPDQIPIAIKQDLLVRDCSKSNRCITFFLLRLLLPRQDVLDSKLLRLERPEFSDQQVDRRK